MVTQTSETRAVPATSTPAELFAAPVRHADPYAREAEKVGPAGAKTRRLLKLAIAIGAMREGTVHSAVRKAVAAGVSAGEIYQIVPMAATTLGFPSTVAVYAWIKETLDRG